MNTLLDKCCPKCIDSEFQRCPKLTECLTKRPLTECHEDEECTRKRNAIIRKIRYGNGIILKLTACSYNSEVEIGNLINTIFTELRRRDLSDVNLAICGGLGNFSEAPFLSVLSSEAPTVVYAQVTEDMIPQIISEHIEQNRVVGKWALGQFSDDTKKLLDSVTVIQYLDFFRAQNLRVLQRCGFIDPENLDEFFLEDGFLALSKALNRMHPDEIVNLIGISGMRGRGATGESVITKWMRMMSHKQTRQDDEQDEKNAHRSHRYLICNAHEGYDASHKDRNLLESDPFGLIEGILVTAYAIQATVGILYINPSYRLAVKRLEGALELAREHNYLGEEILGTDFSFDIEIRRAPSGYLAGEQTSIISFLEGEIGTRPTPPYPEERGIWGNPTLIHNVETFYNIALLVYHDFSWFTAVGVTENPGTKCITLTGVVQHQGIIEVSLGASIRDIVYGIGGELADHPIKAIHIGGPLGGYLSPEYFDTPFEHDALEKLGIRMGTGTIEVLDQSVCLVDRVRKHFLSILQELCGQCTAGREGIYQIFSILQAMCQETELPGARTEPEDFQKILDELIDYIQHTSLCAYCNYATSSLVTSMKYFSSEYDDHFQKRKRCQAGICF